MLFTEYISINIKHVFIGVYNTQSHPSKSRGPHRGQGASTLIWWEGMTGKGDRRGSGDVYPGQSRPSRERKRGLSYPKAEWGLKTGDLLLAFGEALR